MAQSASSSQSLPSGRPPRSGSSGPADVLAAVPSSRPDDAWRVVQALLMLHPTAPPWRGAAEQVERLLADRADEALMSALAQVPAKAVRAVVKRRALAAGMDTGDARPPWLHLLDQSEREAARAARELSDMLSRVNEVPLVEDLLRRLSIAAGGRRREILDELAAQLAVGLGSGGETAAMTADLGSDAVPFDAAAFDAVPFDAAAFEPADFAPRDRMALPQITPDLAPDLAADLAPDLMADLVATVGADKPTGAEEAPAPQAPAPVPPRHLQVVVTDAIAKTQRTASFRPGVQHTVAVTLSPEHLGGLAVAAPLDERGIAFASPDGSSAEVAELSVHFVSDAFGQTTTVSAPITLPRTGASTTATFNMVVDATASTVTCSVLLFQGAALLQSARVTGPVSELDEPVQGAAMRIVADGEFVAAVSAAPAMRSHPVQSSLSTHVGRPGEALMVSDSGREAAVVSLPGAARLREQITEALRKALDADALATTATGRRSAAAAQVRLLRSLAKFGNLLFQELPDSVRTMAGGGAVQLVCGGEDLIPLEIVYDLGFPKPSARLCGQWQQALATGSCTCAPVDGESATICPLGFWGLRLVIERQVADSTGAGEAPAGSGMPSAERNVLPPLDQVLFAASQKVDGEGADATVGTGAIAATVAVLRARLGASRFTQVKTWETWRTTVERRRPGLILVLPHNERDEDDLPRLEIGRGRLLSVGALDQRYVVGAAPTGDQVGPVVFLLGCNTAAEAVPWFTAAAAFRRRGAAVVVGTLSEALGRQTAPMAQMLAELLWPPPGAAAGDAPAPVSADTLGDVMLLIRRRLVAAGMTLGMSLVAFGNAGWNVRQATSAPAEG